MLADQLAEARSTVWDIEKAIRGLSRFEFILEFVRRKTAKKADRIEDYQLRKTKKGWVILFGGTEVSASKDPSKAYDAVRRGPLNYYVRQAEELRSDVLS